jgi:hypothetical protein
MPVPKKHFDVAPIDSHVPQHTSRPIIVGMDSNVRQDPMVRENPPEPTERMLHHVTPALVVPEESHEETASQPDLTPEIADSGLDGGSSKTPHGSPATPDNKDESTEIVNRLVAQKTYQISIHRSSSSHTLIVVVTMIFIVIAISMYVVFMASDTL